MTLAIDERTTSAPTQTLTRWLTDLGRALETGDIEAATSLFGVDSYWRDLVTFSWNITTVEGQSGIADLLRTTLQQTLPHGFAIEGDASETGGIVEGWFTFETATARGRGYVRLKDGLGWTLLTTITELKGLEEKRGPQRDKGVQHGAVEHRETWLERKAAEERELGYTRQPYVVIIGGGQGGIVLGARLKRLGVPTIIVEKNARPGDSWRNRYKTLCLHDPVWYDHLPYLPFPDHWPVFSPKDKIGDWLESYARIMELNYWGSTVAKHAAYDATTAEWSIDVERDGRPVTLRPKHLVFATGVSGLPVEPTIPGAERFQGEQYHSSRYISGELYRGKKAVVIGSNNSAHDICADLWEHGVDVTMVQRSSTHVARSDTLMELALGALYSESALAAGITTDKADLLFASIPYRLLGPLQIPVYAEMARRDGEFYARLEKAGFLLDFGSTYKSGLPARFWRRRLGPVLEIPAAGLGLLHRRWCVRAGRQRLNQTPQRGQRA